MATIINLPANPRDQAFEDFGEGLAGGIIHRLEQAKKNKASQAVSRLQTAESPEEFNQIVTELSGQGVIEDLDDLAAIGKIYDSKFPSDVVQKTGFDEFGNEVDFSVRAGDPNPEGIFSEPVELLFNSKTNQAIRGRKSEHPGLMTIDEFTSLKDATNTRTQMTVYSVDNKGPQTFTFEEGRPPTEEELREQGLTSEEPTSRFDKNGKPLGPMFSFEDGFADTIGKQGADAAIQRRGQDLKAAGKGGGAGSASTQRLISERDTTLRGLNTVLTTEGETPVDINDPAKQDAAVAFNENRAAIQTFTARAFGAEVNEEGIIAFANVEGKAKRIAAHNRAQELVAKFMIKDGLDFEAAQNKAVQQAGAELDVPLGGGDVVPTLLGDKNIDGTETKEGDKDKQTTETKPNAISTKQKLQKGIIEMGEVTYQIPDKFIKKDSSGEVTSIDFTKDDQGRSPLLEELRKQAEARGETLDVPRLIEILRASLSK